MTIQAGIVPPVRGVSYTEMRPHLHAIDRLHEKSGEPLYACAVEYLDEDGRGLSYELSLAIMLLFQDPGYRDPMYPE